VCSWIVALDVLDVDVLAADALADALGDALADALAVGEAVDWKRLLCAPVVLCAVVVACGDDVLSPVVVVVVPVCCAAVAPVVEVVVPVVGVVTVPVVVPVVPVVAVIVPVVGVVVPVVVVVVVGVVDSARGVLAARSWRFATIGPTSPLIPRLMVAFEELSIAPVLTLAHNCSLNTLTTARPRPLGSPPPGTCFSCPPPR
jgi:hypothetical protein